MRPSFALRGLVLTAAALACGEPNYLPNPSLPNAVDTLAVYAIAGTEVWRPSGYSATERRTVRVDQATTVDFAYQITPDGRRILLPGALIGQTGTNGVNPGILVTDKPFDSLTIAPLNGYKTLDTIPASVGLVFYLKGRSSPFCFLGSPTYGKVQVLGFNDSSRTMRFQVLVNGNCGYKSLEPGLPTK